MAEDNIRTLVAQCKHLVEQIEGVERVNPEIHRVLENARLLENGLEHIVGVTGSGSGKCPCCQRPFQR